MAAKKKISTKKASVKKVTKKGSIATKLAAIGSGVAALGAATYYFFGPKGEKHRKEASQWMVAIEKDVAKKLKSSEKITKEAYHAIVDEAVKYYAKSGKVDMKALAKHAVTLKKQWKSSMKAVAKKVSSVKKATKK